MVRVEKECNKKRATLIHCVDGKPIFMMEIGYVLFALGDKAEILLMITTVSEKSWLASMTSDRGFDTISRT